MEGQVVLNWAAKWLPLGKKKRRNVRDIIGPIVVRKMFQGLQKGEKGVWVSSYGKSFGQEWHFYYRRRKKDLRGKEKGKGRSNGRRRGKESGVGVWGWTLVRM